MVVEVDALAMFDKLASELTCRGLEAQPWAPPGRVPCLRVADPAERAIEEDVYAERGRDGLWWFWWPWAERIAPADDVFLAADVITRAMAEDRTVDG